MISNLIRPTKNLGFTDLFLDFIGNVDSARAFYLADDLESVANKLDKISFDRAAIARLLNEQNKNYGVSKEALDNIELLNDARTVCVFSGQQAGLFGGPLMTLVKALGIVKSAKLYSERLKRPVIPIFWIAGDDHDFEEINHTVLLNRSGELCSIKYDAPPEHAFPQSRIKLSDAENLRQAKDALQAALGKSDFTEELYGIIDDCYTTNDTFVTAFGKMMARLTENTGLVLFSPGDVAVKRHAEPFFRKIIEQQDEMHHLLQSTNEKIETQGYHIQVRKKPEATYLFYNKSDRVHILREGNQYQVENKTLSKEEILGLIGESPEDFSPDVITRPLFQSYLFPVLSQKGGPSEIAYFAQINSIFPLFGLPAPVYQARPSLSIVENRLESLMRENDISFEDLGDDFEQTINRVLSQTFPDNIEEGFDSLKGDIESRFAEFSDEMLQFDPALKDFAKQTFGKIDFSLKNFQGKLFSAHKKKSKEMRDRFYRLERTLYPNRQMQERVINVAYFVAKYGRGVIDFMYDSMDSEETSHQLLYLSNREKI